MVLFLAFQQDSDYGEHNNMVLEMEQVKGGSPYGAGTYAGDGSRQPTELELQQAFHHHREAQGICIVLLQ
ncbi:hypothetical protein Lal_00030733 [Lupinus albus]|uniref:Putative NAD(P)H dehydrogenase (Quinone) n=1 Tax=Lupinus albus TaxID=3870 RepID=A0A6A4P7Z7_LUPAL|nr:putative NAD(P)H dehydrogenase (quinone) [Lupinus albus]KAF1863661.1 hypothetical protein Lal_00030733 [Lupinus albus]